MTELPLFPLQTVLYPDGPLSLRIFEPRYLDMISRVMREGSEFGVCLIHEGAETGAATIAGVGTVAQIVDWQARNDGLLGIVVRGGGRFAIKRSWIERDGLNSGLVETMPADSGTPLPAEWYSAARWLGDILARLGSRYAATQRHYEDAAWCGYRFAELLSLPLAQKQVLLEMTNPLERLRMLWPLVVAARQRE